jgi:site-specific DNA recombinase
MNIILSEGSSIKRAAFYGRYSSTMQRRASLEDQKRTCTKDADGSGWIVLEDHCYTDEAKTGTSKHKREGFQALSKVLERKPKPSIMCSSMTHRGARESPRTLWTSSTLRDTTTSVSVL